jgi:hypothetical protein
MICRSFILCELISKQKIWPDLDHSTVFKEKHFDGIIDNKTCKVSIPNKYSKPRGWVKYLNTNNKSDSFITKHGVITRQKHIPIQKIDHELLQQGRLADTSDKIDHISHKIQLSLKKLENTDVWFCDPICLFLMQKTERLLKYAQPMAPIKGFDTEITGTRLVGILRNARQPHQEHSLYTILPQFVRTEADQENEQKMNYYIELRPECIESFKNAYKIYQDRLLPNIKLDIECVRTAYMGNDYEDPVPITLVCIVADHEESNDTNENTVWQNRIRSDLKL